MSNGKTPGQSPAEKENLAQIQANEAKNFAQVQAEVWELGKRARQAAGRMALLPANLKNQILLAMAAALREREPQILTENQRDLRLARSKGIAPAMLDRLTLTAARIADMAAGLESLAALPDPIGQVIAGWRGARDIAIQKTRVPLGVVGLIYEARPNVTADAAGICLKTGNAVILRGSGDAQASNLAIVDALRQAIQKAGGPADAVLLLENPDRTAVAVMLRMNRYLDVLIPRGGAGLIQRVLNEATVPVIETGIGNCHIYVDETADLEMALEILLNAKTQRVSVCNAAESLLVHRAAAAAFLPLAEKALTEKGVELRACPVSRQYLTGAKAAAEEDFAAEFLDFILSVKVVDNLAEAIAHINHYGTGHSEAIVTRDYESAQAFTAGVDAAAVYVNASTRFTDGEQFGFGAEIGISTQKLHARGPLGLEEMTAVKYIIYGQGQVRG